MSTLIDFVGENAVIIAILALAAFLVMLFKTLRDLRKDE